jgi:hypothetical protein
MFLGQPTFRINPFFLKGQKFIYIQIFTQAGRCLSKMGRLTFEYIVSLDSEEIGQSFRKL